MKISCIIPTMNRYDTLKETIESYISGSSIPDQLVIVDQSEVETTRGKIRSLAESYSDRMEVTYFHQSLPSLTAARNKGVQLAHHDLIIFSDDDVTVQSDTIHNVETLMSDGTVAMIAGINSREELSNSKIGYLFGNKSFRNRKIGHVTKSMLGRFPMQKVTGTVETQWAMGFFFVVRKSLIERWSLRWDEGLTGYAFSEDLDFSYSYYKCAKQEGLLCVLSDSVVVEHRVSTEWRIPSQKTTMMYVINREYLRYKHNMGFFSGIVMRWSNFGYLLFRIVKKAKPSEFIHAQIISNKHKKQLKSGIIKPEWYYE